MNVLVSFHLMIGDLFFILQNYLDEQQMRRVTLQRTERSRWLTIVCERSTEIVFSFVSFAIYTTHTHEHFSLQQISSPLKNRINVIGWKIITD